MPFVWTLVLDQESSSLYIIAIETGVYVIRNFFIDTAASSLLLLSKYCIYIYNPYINL